MLHGADPLARINVSVSLGRMLDAKDVAYLVAGIGLFGLTALPQASGRRLLSVPTLYVIAGALLALSPFALPVLDPRDGEGARFLIEHFTELIVIIALAVAGLAVDREAGPLEWQHSWVLLGITMPLTMIGLYMLGVWAGLSVAAAMLLAAVLAPTDPVLARSVQVEGPNEEDEDDVRLSLTTEAGLNDGLAFPFVWLAVALAGVQAATFWDGMGEVGTAWLLYDVGWRVGAGLAVGWAIGAASARFVFSEWGDANEGGVNAGLVFLGTTFLAYGGTEALEGYGFLAVFIAARVGRSYARGTDDHHYVSKPHSFGDQSEKILLALFLIWLGGFAVSGVLADLAWIEVIVALLLIFVLRPLSGLAGLILTRGDRFQRLTISFFGIRGTGSLFYLAFGIGAAESGAFGDLEPVWRIVMVAVLLSIVIHGAMAPIAMDRLDRRRKKRSKAAAASGDEKDAAEC